MGKQSGTLVLDYDRPPNDGVKGLQRLGAPLVSQINAGMPAFMAKNAERFIRLLLTECQRSPKLLDCTPKSLFGGVIQIAQLGLELGGPAGQAYLIPFKANAQVVIGYKGFLALAHRSEKIRRLTPRVVREADQFNIEYGSQQQIVHKPDMGFSSKVTGYYAVVELVNGGCDFEYRTVAQCEAHRERYAMMKRNDGPWFTNFDEMAMKTCIRYLSKRVPISIEMTQAAVLDEQSDYGIEQGLGANLVIEHNAPPEDELRDRLDKAKVNPKYVVGSDDPDAACPACKGAGCATCNGTGWRPTA